MKTLEKNYLEFDVSVKLLIKCLVLTQSENDHEALTAIRKANSIIKNMGVLWEDVLDDDLSPENNYSSPNEYRNTYGSQSTYQNQPENFGSYFYFIYKHNKPTSKWLEIIDSIRDQWIANQCLSDKQAALVKKFYKTAEGKYAQWKDTQENEPVDEW